MGARQDVVLFLDVDGTVGPVGDDIVDPWGDQVPIRDAAFGSVLVSPALLRALGELAVPIVWVTDWEDPSPTFTPAMFGRQDRFAFLTRAEGSGLWWKRDAVDAWLAAHPQVRHVIWCDDHLRRKDSRSGSRAALFTAAMTARGGSALTIAPAQAMGLTPHHLKLIRNGIASLPEPEHQ